MNQDDVLVKKQCEVGSHQGLGNWNPTVEENIDIRIANCEKELARLRQSKLDLAPLLKMRIRDIRSAMDY